MLFFINGHITWISNLTFKQFDNLLIFLTFNMFKLSPSEFEAELVSPGWGAGAAIGLGGIPNCPGIWLDGNVPRTLGCPWGPNPVPPGGLYSRPEVGGCAGRNCPWFGWFNWFEGEGPEGPFINDCPWKLGLTWGRTFTDGGATFGDGKPLTPGIFLFSTGPGGNNGTCPCAAPFNWLSCEIGGTPWFGTPVEGRKHCQQCHEKTTVWFMVFNTWFLANSIKKNKAQNTKHTWPVNLPFFLIGPLGVFQQK